MFRRNENRWKHVDARIARETFFKERIQNTHFSSERPASVVPLESPVDLELMEPLESEGPQETRDREESREIEEEFFWELLQALQDQRDLQGRGESPGLLERMLFSNLILSISGFTQSRISNL